MIEDFSSRNPPTPPTIPARLSCVFLVLIKPGKYCSLRSSFNNRFTRAGKNRL